MRYTQTLIPTRRDAPADAEIISHQLMVRAGLIQKLASGIYTYLPLGWRILKKIEDIIREEMLAGGAEELLLPIIMPASLWKETGRWDFYGKELLRIKDRKDNDFCFGPTHEEAITDLVRQTVKSYRQLPINLFQIQTKFRDEIRPRFGLMRGREFIMKDGYSFDADQEAARTTYQKMFEAYKRIFTRCGLDFRPVEAATGTIGGSLSHEFQVLASSGEDEILSCKQCEYAANIERAEYRGAGEVQTSPASTAKGGSYEKKQTPEMRSVEEVAEFLKVPVSSLIKTLIFEAGEKRIAALVRGDHDVNVPRLAQVAGVDELLLARPEVIKEVTGGPLGFSGPIGIDAKLCPLYADPAILEIPSAVIGANERDVHYIDVVPGKDFEVTTLALIRQARVGDPCPRCEGTLESFRGIEVGQVFYLGEKYSKSMRAVYLDDQGKEQVMVMGCYGIGVGRTAAAAIEQHHDDNGIIWPQAIAPYEVVLLSLQMKDEEVRRQSGELYKMLREKGVDLIWDDRYESPGVKFKDADLIGYPLQLVVGPKGLKEGQVEIKDRRTGEKQSVPISDVEVKLFKELNHAQ